MESQAGGCALAGYSPQGTGKMLVSQRLRGAGRCSQDKPADFHASGVRDQLRETFIVVVDALAE